MMSREKLNAAVLERRDRSVRDDRPPSPAEPHLDGLADGANISKIPSMKVDASPRADSREPATARESIDALLRSNALAFSQPDAPRGCMVVLGALLCSAPNQQVQEDLRAIRLETIEAIRTRIRRGIAEGDVPASADADALGGYYATVLNGLSIQARDGAPREALIATVDCAMAAWDAMARAR